MTSKTSIKVKKMLLGANRFYEELKNQGPKKPPLENATCYICSVEKLQLYKFC